LERVIFSGVDEDMRSELIELAGLNPDLSLLEIDLKETKESMEKHLWIRSVKPEKRFPHTLAIRAEKEESRAVVVMDKLYLMNRWGEIFKEVDPMGELDFPIITGVSNNRANKRKHLLRAAHVSLKDLSEVHVKKDGNISLYFTTFPGVIQARGRDFGFKIDDLKKVVEHLERTGRTQMVRGINLDYQDGAVVSFKNG
jgi:cell division septal protein FtsQ